MMRLLAAVLWGVLSAVSLQAEERFILLQSTTSTENSGLFAHVLPQFTAETGIAVRVVAVGTGQAIRNAQNGDGDVLLVHDTQAEQAFVAAGFGTARHDVMFNDFVLIGPSRDPAEIAGMTDAAAALSKIASAQALFASRGDDSGTHKAELRLWQAAGVDAAAASGQWYRETGAGMGATLNTAIAMGAYVLADRATWTAFGNTSEHRTLVQGDPALFNQYGVIRISEVVHPHVKAQDAQVFVDWVLSQTGQAAIADFRVNGQQVFFPNAK